MAAVAAHFGRNLDASLARIEAVLADAAERGCDLVVFPNAALGGYLTSFGQAVHDQVVPPGRPPALDPDGREVQRLIEMAGRIVLCIGYCEVAGDQRFNAAVCLSGDGVLGRHRKVHQPVGEVGAYAAGDRFCAFDSPLGRVGMLIDYDKTFPESARALALDGAEVVTCLSAWPASLTNRAPRLVTDRQTRLFDLYDCARAAENQVVVVSSNQTGTFGRLRFLGRAKVVGPGGEVLATTGGKSGLAVTELDVARELQRSRRVLHHLVERRPATYGSSRRGC